MTSFGKVLIQAADTSYSLGMKDVRAAEKASNALALSLEYPAQIFDALFVDARSGKCICVSVLIVHQ